MIGYSATEQSSSSDMWYIGLLLKILSSVISTIGVMAQKYSLNNEVKRSKLQRNLMNASFIKEKPYFKQPIWLLGLLIIVFGAILDFVALSFINQSVATSVGGLTLVTNIIFGKMFLNKRVEKLDIVSTGLILFGVAVVAFSGDKTDVTYTLKCLIEQYKRPKFIIYINGVILICILLLMAALQLAKMREAKVRSSKYKKLERFHPLIPTALSGILGSQSVLFAKSTAEILKVTFTEENQFDQWQAYLIVLFMLLCIFSQLHWLAHSLRFFDAVLVVPLFQCFFISGGVIGGGVFFNEFANLSSQNTLVFLSGVGLILSGAYILTLRSVPEVTTAPTTLSKQSQGEEDISQTEQSHLISGAKNEQETNLESSVKPNPLKISAKLEKSVIVNEEVNKSNQKSESNVNCGFQDIKLDENSSQLAKY